MDEEEESERAQVIPIEICCTSHTHMHISRSAAPLTLICVYLLPLTLRSEQAQVIPAGEVQQIYAYVTRPSATSV
jgi:hypothetical protein